MLDFPTQEAGEGWIAKDRAEFAGLFLTPHCNWAASPQLEQLYEPMGGGPSLPHRKDPPHAISSLDQTGAVGRAGCGAIAITFIGFSQLGWKSSQAAADMAQEQADVAVVTALMPFCVAKAEQVSDQDTLAKVKAGDSAFSRSELVMKAGWATGIVTSRRTPHGARTLEEHGEST
jgi:hypothetical protein